MDTVVQLMMIMSALLITSLYLGKSHIMGLLGLGDNYLSLLLLGTALSAINLIAAPCLIRLQLEGRASEYSVLTFMSCVLNIVVSMAGIFGWQWGANSLLIGSTSGSLLVIAASFNPFRRESFYVLPDIQDCRDLVRYGLPLMPSFLIVYSLMNLSKVYTQELWGLDQVGILTLAFTLSTPVTLVTSAIGSAWTPYFMSAEMRTNKDYQKAVFPKLIRIYVNGACVLCLGITLFSSMVLSRFLDSRYEAATTITGLISAAICIQMLVNMLLPPMYYAREVPLVVLIQATALLISIPIMYSLVMSLNVVGGAASVLAGNTALLILTYIFCRIRYGCDSIKIDAVGTVIDIGVCYGVCWLALTLAKFGIPWGLHGLVFLMVAYGFFIATRINSMQINKFINIRRSL